MLLALVCDPKLQTCSGGSLADSEVSCSCLPLLHFNFLIFCFCQIVVLACLPQLQALLSQYLDAACSLLFELLLLGHEVSCSQKVLLLFLFGIKLTRLSN